MKLIHKEEQEEGEHHHHDHEEILSQIKKMEKKSYEGITYKYPELTLNYLRIKNFIFTFSIYTVLGLMLYLIGMVQSNLINTILFFLNVAVICFMVKGDNKPSTFKHLRTISSVIHIFTRCVLVTDIFMLMFFQLEYKPIPDKGTWDRAMYDKFPGLYHSLIWIGFRHQVSNLSSNQKIREEEIQSLVKVKFWSLVAYYMISMYLFSFFNSMYHQHWADVNFKEENFRKLFEFDMEIKGIQGQNDDTNGQRNEEN